MKGDFLKREGEFHNVAGEHRLNMDVKRLDWSTELFFLDDF